MFQDGKIVTLTFHDIIKAHYEKRMVLYEKRKEYQLKQMKSCISEMSDKMKFIEACIKGKIPLTTASNMDLLAACVNHGVNEKYLDMNLRDLTKDKVDKLKANMARTQNDFNRLKSTAVDSIWEKELNDLERILKPSNKKRSYVDLS